MPFTCEWRVPGRVLMARINTDFTLDELREFALVPARMIEQDGTPPVYFIADLRPMRRAPFRLSELRRVIPNDQSENVGCYIMIVSDSIYGFVAAALVKLLRRPVRIVANEDGALATLLEMEPDFGPALGQ